MKLVSFLIILLSFVSLSCKSVKPIKVSKTFMDTVFTITLVDEDASYKDLENAFKIVEENENKYFSSYYNKSMLWEINKKLSVCKNKGKYLKFNVPEKLSFILKESLKYTKISEGAFSINFKIISDIWKKASIENIIPNKDKITNTLNYIKEKPFYLKKEKNINYLYAKCGLSFGLGAIAKGFTLYNLSKYFNTKNITNFLINAGGDILVSGSKNSRAWLTSVYNPKNKSKYLAACKFKDKKISIVSSGSYFRYFTINGKRYSHIIDLNTGYPSTSDIVSISIINENPILADAYATWLYTQGFKKVEKMFSKFSNNGIGIIINNGYLTKMNEFSLKYCNVNK